jgi:chemotaxis protein CheD
MKKILTMANPLAPRREPGPDGAIAVGIGEIVVATAPTMLTTVLGSCIGVVAYAPGSKIGGIAHVMLPEATGSVSPATPGKYADVAIPELIRRVRQAAGGGDGPLQLKIAGGANMFSRVNGNAALQIGPRNEVASRLAIRKLGLSIRGEDIGGMKGRKVIFDPATGAVRVIQLGGKEKEI